uniref:Uncharacterized protein n=1 Tax=Chenopodium quinoa TaxID=63459 RepID=A0A803MTJ8_CHEQI
MLRNVVRWKGSSMFCMTNNRHIGTFVPEWRSWKEDEKAMEKIVKNYYTNLFESAEPSKEELAEVVQHVGNVIRTKAMLT